MPTFDCIIHEPRIHSKKSLLNLRYLIAQSHATPIKNSDWSKLGHVTTIEKSDWSMAL